jgi:antitoxin component YwqK of YwqJK toxin-antitoxin module
MKQIILLISIIFTLFSCSEKRVKDKDELVLAEFIIEKNGVYYKGCCESHIGDKFDGIGNYYHDNGKLKGNYIIKNGIPEGIWNSFNSDGSKKIDLYFKNGKIIKKIKYKK